MRFSFFQEDDLRQAHAASMLQRGANFAPLTTRRKTVVALNIFFPMATQAYLAMLMKIRKSLLKDVDTTTFNHGGARRKLSFACLKSLPPGPEQGLVTKVLWFNKDGTTPADCCRRNPAKVLNRYLIYQQCLHAAELNFEAKLEIAKSFNTLEIRGVIAKKQLEVPKSYA